MADQRASPDTIFAVSSGRPPAAIAIVRISGPGSADVAATLGSRLVPRTATLRALHDEAGGLLDRALVLWFPGPASATGEDLLELHIHGGVAVIAAVTQWLARSGCRQAQSGEFTRRALMNGRLDLTEVEGLADLLAAETESQRRDAILRTEGALGRLLAGWTRRLVNLAAEIEAAIDYDGEDEVALGGRWAADLVALREDIASALRQPPAEILRDGIRVAIVGPVNAGKSTLLNALIGRDAAIVSPLPGTTRDVIEAPVAIGGIPFVFSDTAGLRDATDPIERAGVERALTMESVADIAIDFRDGASMSARTIAVSGRADLEAPAPGRLGVSGLTGAGLPALIEAMIERARGLLPVDGVVSLTQRQRAAASQAEQALAAALVEDDLLFQAEHLGSARRALDDVTGGAHSEDVLDAIFSRFCLGK